MFAPTPRVQVPSAAASGEEGLRLAHQLVPIAIILDVLMPDMDGWGVLETLKSDPTLREIPVIMLTMVDDPERGFTLGAADYATKPVDEQAFVRLVDSLASPVTAEVAV